MTATQNALQRAKECNLHPADRDRIALSLGAFATVLGIVSVAALIVLSFWLRLAAGETSMPPPVSLIKVGASYTTEGGGQSAPMFAIMIGNTEKAERLAIAWSRHFGLHAINATLWVHPVDAPAGVWKRVIYHRPRNIYEGAVFYEDPEVWRFEETDKGSVILPPYARALSPAELAKVDFIITYFDAEGRGWKTGAEADAFSEPKKRGAADGGTKVYVKAWTSPEDAEALFRSLEKAISK